MVGVARSPSPAQRKEYERLLNDRACHEQGWIDKMHKADLENELSAAAGKNHVGSMSELKERLLQHRIDVWNKKDCLLVHEGDDDVICIKVARIECVMFRQ